MGRWESHVNSPFPPWVTFLVDLAAHCRPIGCIHLAHSCAHFLEVERNRQENWSENVLMRSERACALVVVGVSKKGRWTAPLPSTYIIINQCSLIAHMFVVRHWRIWRYITNEPEGRTPGQRRRTYTTHADQRCLVSGCPLDIWHMYRLLNID